MKYILLCINILLYGNDNSFSMKSKNFYKYNANGRIIIPDQKTIDQLPIDGGPMWNRLIFESSPYLLQHAANPINWYPWSDEAFILAKELNKPIFLSIGYTTCHWCHVMEHESFEDQNVANLMNDAFICIKVDREERPDVDNIYMEVTQMMNNRGGWPMTVVMTPDKKPFFSGTYFPKNSRGTRIGMTELIPQIKDAWTNNKDSIINDAEYITNQLKRNQIYRTSNGKISPDAINNSYIEFEKNYDSKKGGFGRAPKFPKAHDYSFLIKYWKRNNKKEALDMVEFSLKKMRFGGIYDQLGFGFHRYSTDSNWLVPHFEKMLYDQALLVHAYLDAYQATNKKFYSNVVEEILEYISNEMTSEFGGFYSAQDADSEGEEGKYYVWKLKEIENILDRDDLEIFSTIFNINEEGNWNEGYNLKTNIPYLKKDLASYSNILDINEETLKNKLDNIRLKLYNHRDKRVHPQKDDKILTDWNGLMISAMARAGVVLNNSNYIEKSITAMDFILNNLYNKGKGHLYKRYRNGKVGLLGVIDDYAFIIWALIELYEATFNEEYIDMAIKLSEYQIDEFWDIEKKGFYFTAKSADQMLVRSKEIYDGAIPSGNSVSAYNFIRIARITSRSDFEDISFKILDSFSRHLNRGSTGYSMMLQAADFAFGPSYEILIFGDKNSSETQNMINSIQEIYMPNRVIVFGKNGSDKIKSIIPFIGYYPPNKDGETLVYVCKNQSCEMPTSDLNKVKKMLGVN